MGGKTHPFSHRLSTYLWSLAIVAGLVLPVAATAGGVHYQDTAAAAGIVYQRAPSATLAIAEAIRAQPLLTPEDFAGPYPIKPHGAPGVALLDHDGDGDLDIYVTNGPGAANSLFSSRLAETGELAFTDVGVAAGVGAVPCDSTGVCFGDIDNDGDPDLYVLSRGEPNRLFENLGGGHFLDITEASGAGGGNRSSMSCSMGDIDGDGLLDIAVSNTFDMSNSIPIFIEPFALNERNQLFLNTGGNTFADVSEESGIAAVQDITWAIALVDIDRDGDADVIAASDNAAIPQAELGGVDRGFVRWFENDGTGHFTEVTEQAGLTHAADWMGLAFADLDHNGTLDIFGTNTGDYFENLMFPFPLGLQATRWFLQGPDGTFDDPGVGGLVASPFGWGTAALDYDNDGDADLISYGGLDAGPFVESSNPGCLLENDGHAVFSLDGTALAGSVSHTHRVEHGLAVGDLNADGFPDIVSVSALNLPAGPPPLLPFPFGYGSVFDGLARFFPTFLPTGDGHLVFSGVEFPPGDLAVEINSGDNGNGWVAVKTLGTVGLVSGGRANRDGIGAVITVTPEGGAAAMLPVLGGSSYASQHGLEQTFGLGSARRATVEVLWPGGVRNRLYNVRPGERVVLPEIPCDLGDGTATPAVYAACVTAALDELVSAGALDPGLRGRFLGSALRAFAEERR